MPTIREEVARVVRSRKAEPTESVGDDRLVPAC